MDGQTVKERKKEKRGEKKEERKQTEVKLSLFVNDMIVYKENQGIHKKFPTNN